MLSDLQLQRHVELEGTTNLRNLGGYHTKDGTKTTKWGVLYRSDSLADVPADKAQSVLVNQLHIHNAYDLRADKEVTVKSYEVPHITRHVVPIDTTHMARWVKEGEDLHSGPVTFRVMQEIYREFVRSYGPTVGAIIKGILASSPSSNNASLIHCTAGKDRTGWSVYVILSLLDIKEEEKRSDYLLTNAYFKTPKDAYDYLGGLGMGPDAMKVLWSVFDEFLDAGIEELSKFGSVEAYAKSHMGLTDDDIQQLRALLLE
ncbi:Tyrosine phosphatase family [Lotmaria passim]